MIPFQEEIIDQYNRYLPGPVSYEYSPAEEKYKNMLTLVAYDIREPKRLRKIAKICEQFGIRVEYSVFECDLDETHFSELWKKLTDAIDQKEDAILAYKICGMCVPKIMSMGSVVRPAKPLLYII